VGYLRFWRRKRILPGVTLNFSKRGVSTSVGVRGAHVTVGRRGIRRTVGIPGTGVYYTSVSGRGRRPTGSGGDGSDPPPDYGGVTAQPRPPHLSGWGWFWLIVVITTLVWLLGLIAIVVIPVVVLSAALVAFNPRRVGDRIRSWPVWRGVPALGSRTSVLAFAAALLLYGVPAPLLGYALEHVPQNSASIATITTPTPTPPEPTLRTAPAVGGDVVAPTTAPTVAPTPPPTALPTAAPTAPPATAPPATAAPTAAPANTCGAPTNPWGYNFCGGNLIQSPPSNFCDYFNCIPSFWKSTKGYVDQCSDGMFSHSGGRSGACSSHGGESRPLYGP
jgi:hypothetical protein